MIPFSPNEPAARPPLTHEPFMRLFLQSERELLRYVMALVPNVADARDVVQETAVALWQAIGKYDPARPFVPWAYDQWWADVQPLLVNESVTNIPTINSFKELYYKQFGGSPSYAALRKMNPTKTPGGDGAPKAKKKRKSKARQ